DRQEIRDRPEEQVVRPVPEQCRSERSAEGRNEDQKDDEDPARNRDLVATEAKPDLLPVASRLDLDELAELGAGLGRHGGGEADAGAVNLLSFRGICHRWR